MSAENASTRFVMGGSPRGTLRVYISGEENSIIFKGGTEELGS